MRIEYIRNPPLKKVIIQFHFEKVFDLKISEVAVLYNRIQDIYNIEPNMGLVPLKGKSFEIRLGTLRYSDEANKKFFEIGENFVIFTTIEYSRWDILRDEILGVLFKINDLLKGGEIINLFITYIDEFNIDKEDFVFGDNFTIKLLKKKNWKIDFSDFHLGLVPFNENGKKIILRIKSRENLPDKYRFSVETVYISRSIQIKMDIGILKQYLDSGHEKISSYFAELIYNTQLQEKIGMKIEE